MNKQVLLSSHVREEVPKGLSRRAAMMGALAGLSLSAGGVAILTQPSAAAFRIPGAFPKIVNWPRHSMASQTDWSSFKSLYITADGRVVDTGNRGVSHTESQGLGLLFAASFDDRETFDRIYTWTSRTLQRSDSLYSWRYISGQTNTVSDPNNATDGDIYIAAALQMAGTRWSSSVYLQEASKIAQSILEKCTIEVHGQKLLLPGASGFVKQGHVVVNPSYYVFPLISQLDLAFPSQEWKRLADDGVRLIADARFGKWSLPSDWLQVQRDDGAISMADGFPPRFSYDALRIPLFLAWAGLSPDTVSAVSKFWNVGCAAEPSYADLKSSTVMGHFTLRGAKSIARFIASSKTDRNNIKLDPITATDPYYSSALHLLTRIASAEMSMQT